jgi:antitoxin ParD1/3/4
MASSVHLDTDLEAFVAEQVRNGQYDNADDVVRDALRNMKIRVEKLKVLKAHLAEGARESELGLHVENFSFEQLIDDAEAEENARIPDYADGRSRS